MTSLPKRFCVRSGFQLLLAKSLDKLTMNAEYIFKTLIVHSDDFIHSDKDV